MTTATRKTRPARKPKASAEARPAAKPASARSVATGVAETWMDIWSEAVGFMAARLQEDVRTQHELLHCRSPLDFHAAQVRYMQKVIDDCQHGVGRMARHWCRLPSAKAALRSAAP